MFTYFLGDPNQHFSISPTNSNHGTTLSRVKVLDREKVSSYNLIIEAVNDLQPFEPVTQNIMIKVTDLNDNKAIFQKAFYNVTLPEDTPVGSHVIKVLATDADIDQNAVIQYAIIPGSAKHVFAIDSATGDIKLTYPLDREQREVYVLFIEANDGKFTNYTELTITVSDVNEHKPYFLKTDYTTSIKETIGPLVPIITIMATDKDSGNNAKIIYTIVEGDPDKHFAISETGVLYATQALDYETNSTYDLVVEIEDKGQPVLKSDMQAKVKLFILNTNDNRPQFSKPEYVAYVKENSRRFEEEPFQVYAEDPDKG